MTSIRLTVFLLLLLAVIAVIGTVVPQDEPLVQYLSRFGETLGILLVRGGFARIYYSPWFLGPIGLLALNILACLVHRLPQAVRRVSRPFTWEMALTLPERGRFQLPATSNPGSAVPALLRPELGRPRHQQTEQQQVFFYERGRWRPLGPYLVHFSLLLILAGGLIGKFWGIEGRLLLNRGEEAGTFHTGPGIERPLGFKVRLDDFQVEFYERGGLPKEFRSDLTFEQGQEMERLVCRVNYPVTFGAFTFYQSSYGTAPTGPISVKVCRGDDCQVLEASLRRRLDLPGGGGKIMLLRADGNLQGYGPAVQLAYQHGPGHPEIFWLLKDHPQLTEQPGPHRFTLTSLPFQYYSVFQVKHDPGVWWVYGGFILLLPGFYLAFFRPLQRWAVVLEPTPQGAWKGRLLGASPRARDTFLARQERLLALLQKGTLP